MSSIDWVPELAAALDELVPPGRSSQGDWADVVGRVGRRGERWFGRRLPSRRLRLALVVALLFLLLTGVATATYLLVWGNNGGIALGGGTKLLVVNQGGSGVRAVAVATCAKGSNCEILEPSWSPDGTRIAFLRGGVSLGDHHKYDYNLYVAAADGGDVKRLAACGDCGWSPGHLAWSPDGKWIAFSNHFGGGLWLVAANGGALHRLTGCDWPCGDEQPTWSPDGHRIVFVRTVGQGVGRNYKNYTVRTWIYTIRPDGSGLTRITRGKGKPAWSPDGRRIVFERTGPMRIAVVNAATHHVHVLLTGTRRTGPRAPSWSPDGRKLVFFFSPSHPGNHRAGVWTMNADGSDKKQLCGGGAPWCRNFAAGPIWSPDGHLIAFSGSGSAGGTFVINADGSGLRRLTPVFTLGALSWQPPAKKEGK